MKPWRPVPPGLFFALEKSRLGLFSHRYPGAAGAATDVDEHFMAACCKVGDDGVDLIQPRKPWCSARKVYARILSTYGYGGNVHGWLGVARSTSFHGWVCLAQAGSEDQHRFARTGRRGIVDHRKIRMQDRARPGTAASQREYP